MSTLRELIEKHVDEFTYMSSRPGIGMRHLPDHIKKAVVDSLESFIQGEIDLINMAIAHAMEDD